MDDLISREKAIDAVYERIKEIGYEGNPYVLSIRQTIRDIPSAQPEHDKLHPKKDPNFSSCSHCVHDEDSEEICILRKCVHAIADLKECYTERRQDDRP